MTKAKFTSLISYLSAIFNYISWQLNIPKKKSFLIKHLGPLGFPYHSTFPFSLSLSVDIFQNVTSQRVAATWLGKWQGINDKMYIYNDVQIVFSFFVMYIKYKLCLRVVSLSHSSSH